MVRVRPPSDTGLRVGDAVVAEEEILRDAFESFRQGVVVAAPGGQIVLVNPAFEKLAGRSRKELVGTSIFEYLSSSATDHHALDRPVGFGRKSTAFSLIYLKLSSGSSIAVRWSVSTLASGKAVHSFGDLRAQLELERQLSDAERMNFVGEILSGIAHDLATPMTIIAGSAEDLLDGGLSPSQAEDVRAINDASGRCVALLERLRRIVRRPGGEVRWLDLVDPVQDAIQLAEPTLRKLGITVDAHVCAHPLRLKGDPDQLQRLVLNLLFNARDALEDQDGPRQIRVEVRADSGGAHLTIGDSGPGIPPDQRELVVETFYSTKARDKGTGLGLSICKSIANSHGGTLEVRESGLGGAEVSIYIPLTTSTAPPQSSEELVGEVAAKTYGGRFRLLVVDPEDLYLEVALRAVEPLELGRVDLARNAAEAFRTLTVKDYDVVVCQAFMPEMSGLELFQVLRTAKKARVPDFVVTYPASLEPVARPFMQEHGLAGISKPFEPADLREVICRRLPI